MKKTLAAGIFLLWCFSAVNAQQVERRVPSSREMVQRQAMSYVRLFSLEGDEAELFTRTYYSYLKQIL